MKFAVSLLLILAASFSIFAQNPANFPWWNSTVVDDKSLNITPAQKQKIHDIVRAHRGALLDARNAVQKAEGDLEDLLNDPSITSEMAKPVIEKVSDARANSTRVFLDMSIQLRGVLTLDQWRVLVLRWDAMKRKKLPDTQVPP
jgi:Spy/CpxP family protein refolding chaperone